MKDSMIQFGAMLAVVLFNAFVLAVLMVIFGGLTLLTKDASITVLSTFGLGTVMLFPEIGLAIAYYGTK